MWLEGVSKVFESGDNAGSSRPKDEQGASAVEMALVLPALVLILAGIIDFGLVFNDLMALRQGVGAGVRQGVVAQAGTSSTCTLTGAAAANTETKKLMCLTKSLVALDETDTRTMVSFPGSRTKGGSMILCAQTPLESATTVFDPLLDGALKAKVHMRIEQDLSSFGSASESALADSDWSWCV
jgi:Flp pilus assembly pilin Flp